MRFADKRYIEKFSNRHSLNSILLRTIKDMLLSSTCAILIVCCFSIGEVRSLRNGSSDAANSNATVCQQDCLEKSHPCHCFTDGWMACEARNLTKIPTIPACARMIVLENNAITEIGHDSFSACEDAETIDLSYNKIEKIGPDFFRHLKVLKALILHRNSIVEISECAFAGLSQMTSLDLSVNQIASLPGDVFDQNPALQELALYHNNVTEIQTRWFENKTQWKFVFLEKNPWNCTCQLWNSFQFVLNRTSLEVKCEDSLGGIISSMCISCNDPASLNGIGLHKLKSENFTNCAGIAESRATSSCRKTEHRLLTTSEMMPHTWELSASTTDDRTAQLKGNDASTATHTTWTSTAEDDDHNLGTTTNSVSIGQHQYYTTPNVATTSTINIKRSQGQGVEWWLVLIIILVSLALFGLLGLAMWCGKKTKKRLIGRKHHSQISRTSGDYAVVYQQ